MWLRGVRMMRSLCVPLACVLLAGCAPAPSVRGRDIRDGAGLPRAHPPGVVAAFPPADTSFTPLRCVLAGPDTECSRQ